MLRFSADLSPFAVGRRVNSEEWNAITGNFEAASDATRLGFGVPVKPGTGRDGIVPLTAASGEIFLGVTEASAVLPRPGDLPASGGAYARYDEVSVLEWGVLAVEVEGNVTRGAIARWNTVSGKWTAAAQSATVVTIPGITFEEAATAPGVTPIRIRKVANPALTAVT